MRCPFCGFNNSKVVDSRPSEDNKTIKRRRECEKCNRRFNTFEKYEIQPVMVIKKDETREEFNRKKVQDGIIRSCHKRPVSSEQINKILDEIEEYISSFETKEVKTSVIGELVMEKLKDIDEVAYVRFASVYREFRDADTFVEEIGKLKKKGE
jgi:transcriptional regulator nrdR